MERTKDEIFVGAARLLADAWDELETADVDAELLARAREVMSGHELAPRFALVTQLLLKHELPGEDASALALRAPPAGLSPRSLAKSVVVPFNVEQGQLLGGSEDPYVSNPLRPPRTTIQEFAAGPDAGEQWRALGGILAGVESGERSLMDALIAALAAMKERRLTLRDLIAQGLDLQAHEAPSGVRRELMTSRGPALLQGLVSGRLGVQGSGGVGTEAEVPWIRIYDPELAPSAQEGWYLVYLFSADGSAAFLCLMQGVTHPNIEMIASGVEWARGLLGPQDRAQVEIDLRSRQGAGSRPTAYERATAYAVRYSQRQLPDEEQLRADLQYMLELLARVYEAIRRPEKLTVEAVLPSLEARGLRLPDHVVLGAVAALRSGQHLLLTGPPGTGKTTFAEALAAAAASSGLSTGYVLATATAEWSSVDVVGGYWPVRDDPARLEFRVGQALGAIDAERWLIIDELNRADVDKALGQLFTALSGQVVALPFEEEIDGVLFPVSIVPSGQEAPSGTSGHRIAPGWRLIATLNTRDRDLLFSLSYALLRRFAVIEVPRPGPSVLQEIIKTQAPSDVEITARIDALIELPHRPLGPAVLLDVARLCHSRLELGAESPERVLADALVAFVLPQLDDLSEQQQRDVIRFVKARVLQAWAPVEIAELFASTFHAQSADLVDALEPEGDLDVVDGG
jgi:MoxR-like ATPase